MNRIEQVSDVTCNQRCCNYITQSIHHHSPKLAFPLAIDAFAVPSYHPATSFSRKTKREICVLPKNCIIMIVAFWWMTIMILKAFGGKNGLMVDHYSIQCTAMLKVWTEKHSWHRLILAIEGSTCNGAIMAGLTTFG